MYELITHTKNPFKIADELETQNGCYSTAMLNLEDREYPLIKSPFLLPEGNPKAYCAPWPLVLPSGIYFLLHYSLEPYLKIVLKNMLTSAFFYFVEC